MCNADGSMNPPFTLPVAGDGWHLLQYESWKKGEDFILKDFTGEEMQSYFRHLRSFPLLDEAFKKSIAAGHPMPERQVHHVANFSQGNLLFITLEPYGEAHDIFKRFAKVFEQTYTRFLDLQKAEAQAKEAQIEAALERVRSSSLAMHRSDELQGVVNTVIQQLKELHIELDTTNILIFNNESKSIEFWTGSNSTGKQLTSSWHASYTDDIVLKEIFQAQQNGQEIFLRYLSFEEKNRFFDYLFTKTDFKNLNAERKKFIFESKRATILGALVKDVAIQIISYSRESFLSDEIEILKRFAKVFEQAHTRFLDLQKAEAQARESQIQLALERVRARTMAMQRSDELKETSSLLFKQVNDLGIKNWSAGFNIWDSDGLFLTDWMTSPSGGFLDPYKIPLNEFWLWKESSAAKQQGEEFLEIKLDGEKLKEGFTYLSNLPDAKEKAIFQSISLAGFQLPEYVVNNYAFFSQGSLLFVTYEPVPEAHDIFKRFAKVFEQTYTRFLDLQKAEAQAKEAKIEASLERVRSRSLAMHKSDELREVVKLVFKNLEELEFAIDGAAFIAIPIEGSKDINIWIGDNHAEYPVCFRTPFYDVPAITDIWKAKESGLDFYSRTYTTEEKNVWFKYAFEETDYKFLPDQLKKWILEQEYLTQAFAIAKNSMIGIHYHSKKDLTTSEIDILKRFSKVFDQSYVRFLDLQKAEAQAREAQIEAALERVRSRTMGMQKSNELGDVAVLLYRQFLSLGVSSILNCGYVEIDEINNIQHGWMTKTDGSPSESFNLPMIGDPVFQDRYDSWKRKDSVFHQVVNGDQLKKHIEFTRTKLGSKEVEELVVTKFPDPTIFYCGNFSNGYLHIITGTLLSKDEETLLERFTRVFEQTYTRFLDLQKAEAQAREAKIETGLERVRSRAMAMQTSEELNALIGTVFTELTKLDLVLTRCVIIIYDPATMGGRWWMANSEAPDQPMNFFVKHHTLPFFTAYIDRWKERTIKWQYILEGQNKITTDDFLFTETELSQLPGFVIAGMRAPGRVYLNSSFNNFGNLTLASIEPLSDEHFNILLRFAKVFDLTYTRFNDLKQAEAQAREAQIEVSLERVRSKAMAMQKSEDLANAVATVFEELDKLNLGMLRCGIGILNKEKRSADVWTTTKSDNDTVVQVSGDESMDIHPLLQGAFDAWLNQEDHSYVLKGEDLNDYYKAIAGTNFKLPDSQSLITGSEGIQQLYFNAVFSSGGLFAFRETEFPQEAKAVLKRFADVFTLTYTRFNDLKQAEAQAREAQIELGLERVRARAMAMQKSDELADLVDTVFKELTKLHFKLDRCIITIIDENSRSARYWMANPEIDNIPIAYHVKLDELPYLIATFNAWKERKTKWVYDLKDEEKRATAEYMLTKTELRLLPEPAKKGMLDSKRIFLSSSFSNFGSVQADTLEPLSDENLDILYRFGKVFDLTYTRFNDLKQAEAQAREATIEAALEKVRGKAMAMHNSNDLSSTASIIFTELRKIGINPIRCGVGLLNKESRKAQLYSATSSPSGDSLSLIGWVLLSGHPVLENIYDTWLKNEDYFPELSGEQLTSYYQLLLKGLSVAVPDSQGGQTQYGTFLPFSVGCLYAWSDTPYNDTEIKILKRFATIIDLTFRRYMELQKSEATAREAVKQSALDRVRADIASMRTISDLDRITPLIWNELTILGVPFIRCGVFIMDESQQLIHTFLSTPDGKAIAAFHLPYNTPGNIGQVLSHWHDKKNYIDHWDESAFTEFANILVKQGELASAEQYLKTIPHGGFYLHFLPFLQGMLYVGNSTQLNEEEINLVQSVADAFSTAYARYEDFNKLEAAKQQVEKTLVDLKQAQTQLVQSEKMASLGELTAGIAHEIQNPLNFVNNFSEVSNELLAEMEEELGKGNYKGALDIANDVKQNLEKINHHGKRADGIVKGMLQHSRTSSGQKELTDINILTDEYLRLCYHGLRAKDKSFNASIKTDFAESIGKINIIPQDIGRVILNLLTNAFYAASLPSKGGFSDSDKNDNPTVWVNTKKVGDKVLISVRDNGRGIPQKVLDKIFQPFFTTKPTGQGTGLGLSLSYDIVKAHGGELKVETKEGEGSEFIIQLPVV
jgi:signal transduction histidine kinase